MKTTGQTHNGLRIRIPANPLQQLTGREPKTTFWQDFSIADMYGAEAVRDTYNRAFAEWRSNTEYLCEFVVCLNHKIWQHYEQQQREQRQSEQERRQAEAAADISSKEQALTAAAAHAVAAAQQSDFAKLYDELWKQADEWAMDNLTGNDMQQYLDFTD